MYMYGCMYMNVHVYDVRPIILLLPICLPSYLLPLALPTALIFPVQL